MDGEFEAYLSADGVDFGAADASLLRAIAERGSVNAAAAALGRSRARALARLDALEAAFGPLVERRRGGSGGGGSSLTGDAEALLARFERLRAALSGTAGAEETVLYGTVATATGELGYVDTAAGTVRALLVAPEPESPPVARGSRVQVSVRADAVTLHAPDDAPPAGGTSARNRFPGTVAGVDRGEAIVRVAVDVGGDGPLVALVTADSADGLAIEPGRSVVASFKATATRATAVEE
ncbi:TOBE domain-containing protein [Halegenticoccus soli]|uniref:TOBE domain-containing protein n=1 Tax=Halegenticoccus soli TaxID=1985678 RepID=UPI000C6E8E50|nr:TOBE domain-containing protein [Halegenticoccus soli]